MGRGLQDPSLLLCKVKLMGTWIERGSALKRIKREVNKTALAEDLVPI